MDNMNIGRILVLLIVYVLTIRYTYLYWFRPKEAQEKVLKDYARFHLDPFGIFSPLVRTSFWIWMSRLGGLVVIIAITYMIGKLVQNAITTWK